MLCRLHTSVAVALSMVLPHAAVAQSTASSASVPHGAGHTHYVNADQPLQSPTADGRLAPRLQNLGTHVFPVTTRSATAQRFMNQGLNLAYGFNHAESGRAFSEAARLDPSLAMAYWGQALVLGPNINAPMDPAAEAPARELVQKALSLRRRATPREAALIDALAQRYSGKPEERAARDKAYAEAMGKVARRFPNDLDIVSLYVESVMDLRPWGYWMPDGKAYEGTAEIQKLLESAMKRNPRHPGALHFYIHLMEPTDTPELAEGAADRLLTLMPAAGHMVHMSSHIYQRVGRYADAMRSNELAVAADEDYITQCRAQGMYPMGYYPHNLHFLWFAATMAGNGRAAVDAARRTASKAADDAIGEMPFLAGFRVVPYYALTRFGKWDEMLAEARPAAGNPFLQGIWHYARGLAFVAKNQLDEAGRELVEVERIASGTLDFTLFSPNPAQAIFAIAPEVLGAEIAAARKDYANAINRLERAVRLEDGLVYTEPAEWHYPTRHTLGAVLLDAGRPKEAETVYWEDLKRNPDNGWALAGLRRALDAQGKKDQGAVVEARFAKAWAHADTRIEGSRLAR